MTQKQEIEKALNGLIELGVLRKDKKGYIDNDYSREIDKMQPRVAFIEGVEKGSLSKEKDVLKIINKVFNHKYKDIHLEKSKEFFRQEIINRIKNNDN